MEFGQWTKVEPCEMENDVDIRNDLQKQSWLGEMGGRNPRRWQNARRQAHTHKAVVSAYAVTI